MKVVESIIKLTIAINGNNSKIKFKKMDGLYTLWAEKFLDQLRGRFASLPLKKPVWKRNIAEHWIYVWMNGFVKVVELRTYKMSSSEMKNLCRTFFL